MININSLSTVVELFDSDVFFINNSPSQSGISLKEYIAGGTSPIVDTDTILKANPSTGYAGYVTVLNLKDYCDGSASPVVNNDVLPVYRGGDMFKTTALSLKSYLTDVPIDFLPIIVMAGQSNEEGDNADTAPISAPYTGVLADAKVFFKNNITATNNGVIQSLQAGVNNQWRTGTSSIINSIGPEISLGYQLPIDISHPIGVVKFSLGGSRLVDNGVTNSNGGLWDVDGDASRGGSFGLLFPILVNYFVLPAIQKYIAAGYTPKIAAFHWCQGEADATIEYCADNYQTKLVQLLDTFKDLVRAADPNVDNMAVVISRIHNNFTPGTRPYLNTVRAAQVSIGTSYTNASWIDTDSYPVKPDNTHWTKAAQITHGNDITNILSAIL